ncbi:uncharacterized membrane protein YhaH (DUF805 family) [Geodermatophilus normandii]|uniref:Uncharacterized membrane protein YhaH (DUF805 family) n=1 Tax=Geodermatophilus normandii TaxID=1137989 RepID=A0A317QJA3_9ACTN|nr:DUF805 domain-containing protein [Geodermatophilus normandii]PWW22887.1 uncharacterized membrane protein YhaH (DUF805 family) [Geodermatophilus normandii]
MSEYSYLGYGNGNGHGGRTAPGPAMEGSWYVRRGRIDRRTYWLHYALPLWAASVAAIWADLALGTAFYRTSYESYGYYSYSTGTSFAGGLFTLLVTFALFAPSISAAVTRLHDTGRSGWFLLWGLVPIAGPIVLFVVVGCLPGEPGRNQYDGAAYPGRREPQLATW